MAQRGGVARQLACCCFLVVLALACGVASAATAPRKSVPATGPPKNIPKTEFQKITFSRSSANRQYVITCRDRRQQPCIVSCPPRCPNECLASCTYCMSFCSTSAVSLLYIYCQFILRYTRL